MPFPRKTNKPEARQALTEEQAWPRLLRYCAYQERAPQEVVRKMSGYGLDTATQERLLQRLREDNYLSAERYAQAYAGGKLRQNRWGKSKIKLGLASKGIDKELATDAIANLDEGGYRASLRTLLERKDELRYKYLPMLERRQKLWRLGVSHGFEAGLVSAEIKRITNGLPTDADDAELQP